MTTPPPIAPDVDLRGLDYMPLFGNHLFGSEFNAAATDSEWRAALTLWWAAWNQVPAGSLPNDDAALCRLADLGRDVKTWKRLRERALHGFVECSDGRLYHSFICRQVLVAWDKRVKERGRKAKWRAEQDAKRTGHDADVPRDKTGTGHGQNGDATPPSALTGKDGTGRDDKEQEKRTEADASAAAASPDPKPMTARERVFTLGPALLGEGSRSLLGKLAKEYGDDVLADVLAEATLDKPIEPKAWVTASCAVKAKAKGARNGVHVPDMLAGERKPQWATDAGFEDRFAAESAGCGPGNCRKFRDGKRITEAA